MEIHQEQLVNEKYWFDKERTGKSLLNTYYFADPANASSRSTETTQI